MTTRTRMIITFATVCHLLLAPQLLTSQAQPATATPIAATQIGSRVEQTVQWVPTGTQADRPTDAMLPGELITSRATQVEKVGDLYTLRGDVEVSFRRYTLKADEITYNSVTGEITATGHMVFDGGPHDEHITATRGSYNVNTESGTFYDVVGTTGAQIRGRKVSLTSSNPFSFVGARVDKKGPDKIVVYHGTVTSCRLPRPKWAFRAHQVEVVAGEDAKIYNTTFWLWRVPVFYFPFMDHPVERLGRKSGFLLPTIGRSSRKGYIFGDSYFWAINRSMDATIGAEYYSRRGWAQHGEFRAKLTEDSLIMAQYFGVVDRGIPTSSSDGKTLDQGGREVRVNASGVLRPGLRGVADIDYLSSYIFRAAFSETFSQAINSEVRSTAFLSDNRRGYSFNTMISRYQNFQNTNTANLSSDVPESVQTIVHAPSFEASSIERRIGKSPAYWSFDAAAEGVSRREPKFVSADLVSRFDVYPRVSMPLYWQGWTFRPEIALRNTWYSDSQVIVDVPNESGVVERAAKPSGEPINRRSFQGTFEIRPPALSRIFDTSILSYQVKHTIEPRVTYNYTSGVKRFSNIQRFDERDILSNTNEVEYAVVNRLYARRAGKDCSRKTEKQPVGDCSSREVISWELAQKYFIDPTFGGAVVSNKRNVFTTTEELTGISFLTQPRRFSPVVSRLRMRGPNTDVEWHLDYDTKLRRINSSMALMDYKFLGDFHLGGGHTFLETPPGEIVADNATTPSRFNQFRILAAYGNAQKPGFAAGTTLGFDAKNSILQYSAMQTTYNWDCCGVTIEYRRWNIGAVRNENQFRFALSLSNVGTFGTLRKQERLF